MDGFPYDLIKARRAYIDTVVFHTKEDVIFNFKMRIESACREEATCTPLPSDKAWKYRYRFSLAQPSRRGLEIIRDEREDAHLSEAHVALDLITETSDAAYKLQRETALRFDQRWPGNGRISRYKKTLYARHQDDGPGPNAAMYSDKPSKTDGRSPCLHLELRAETAGVLRKWGIRSIDDLIDTPPRRIIERQLRLYEVDKMKLARVYVGETRRTPRPGDKLRAWRLCYDAALSVRKRTKALGYPWPMGSVMALKEHIGSKKLRKCLKEVSIEPLLPPLDYYPNWW